MEKEKKQQIKLYVIMIVGLAFFAFSFVNFILTNRVEYFLSDRMNPAWVMASLIFLVLGFVVCIPLVLVAFYKSNLSDKVGSLLYVAVSYVGKKLFN